MLKTCRRLQQRSQGKYCTFKRAILNEVSAHALETFIQEMNPNGSIEYEGSSSARMSFPGRGRNRKQYYLITLIRMAEVI
jgi:hypothetical protein